VYDAISARIAEDVGFEVMMFAGSIASATVLGAPDYIVLTLTEFAEQIHRICRAGTLPLMVDSDHGYGNALNVKRTVEELETAGVAALTIEDTLLPRAFGSSGPQLLSMEEGVGKMKAALAGRQDPSLVIAGRTSACGIEGLEEGIRRAKAYQDVGVDALFFAGGINSVEDLEAIHSEISIPILMGGGGGALGDREILASHGVRVALQGHMPFLASVKATYDTLKALRDGMAPSDLANQPSSELIAQLTRQAEYDSDTDEFLN
jgi:carboxyvinyl-carboxyphosphonate phosphorylmutase